jgi:hypothetical protein
MAKPLQQLINEISLLGVGRNLLFHWTHESNIISILRDGKLFGPVHFTRNPAYKVKDNSSVRLVFDKDLLQKRGYRFTPRVDDWMKFKYDDSWRQDFARGEAEELSNKPVELKDGLIKIQSDKATKEFLDMWTAAHESEDISKINKIVKQIEVIPWIGKKKVS